MVILQITELDALRTKGSRALLPNREEGEEIVSEHPTSDSMPVNPNKILPYLRKRLRRMNVKVILREIDALEAA